MKRLSLAERAAPMTAHMRALRLDRLSLNVDDLPAVTRFYTDALGFVATPAHDGDPALARLLGARRVRVVRLQRGRQCLELTACHLPGAPYPIAGRSNDLWFQHCALVTDDMRASYDRLAGFRYTPISRHGQQTLPGGTVAYKFRDPNGHPLELIQFPRPDPRTLSTTQPSAWPTRSGALPSTRCGLASSCKRARPKPDPRKSHSIIWTE
jgi:catechol 2,3-dioxygenase-like lactoylglutathione lyase family enzyme